MNTRIKNALKFLSGLVAGVALAIIVPVAILATGMVDMSAMNKPGKIENALAPWALARSMKRHAPKIENPHADDASVLASGLAHYRENCVICHGAPGLRATELAQGLNPPAPELAPQNIAEFSDGELFYIVKNGIRMTGMPAFGVSHSDEEIWKIASFVRHLPEITGVEREELKSALDEMGHHHEGSETEEHHQPAPDSGEAKSEAESEQQPGERMEGEHHHGNEDHEHEEGNHEH